VAQSIIATSGKLSFQTSGETHSRLKDSILKFDVMGAAMDWLDAYRAGELETILKMYADDAVIECGCSGMKVITGQRGIRAYWVQRFKDYPASKLEELLPTEEGAIVSYITTNGLVGAGIQFDPEGKISRVRCARPLAEPTSPHPQSSRHWLLAQSIALWGSIGVCGWLIWRLFQ